MVIKNCAVVSFGIIFLFSNLIFAEQAPQQRWAARYNGDANNSDEALAIVADNSGNIYVTGYSYGLATGEDYATIKYDPNGNQLWVSRYSGPSGIDKAVDIAVDNAGNIYVTGFSDGNSGFDYATIKYDSNGNQLWAARYDGPEQGNDAANALAVDNLGNVYVTGYSFGNGGNDYATVKYDPNGKQLWASRYSNGYANDVAVDNSGNIYVTGESTGSGSGQDYVTIKYGPSGNQLWEARYTGPNGDYDSAAALAVDNSGNVYVTGSSYGGGSRYDYATIKYNSSGSQLWIRRYDGPGHQTDEAHALKIDNAGNVYVYRFKVPAAAQATITPQSNMTPTAINHGHHVTMARQIVTIAPRPSHWIFQVISMWPEAAQAAARIVITPLLNTTPMEISCG